MEYPIPKSVKKIWDKWNLRGFVMLSLSLQIFLILSAPLRKRTSNKWVIVPIWFAYLLADWAANFAVGLISSSQADTQGADYNGDLLVFWAPFLLLHLGGPDTIIAIAIEDNALWPRHFLGLIFQVLAAAYVFGQSYSQNKLRVPTLLLFLAGTIKYAERTLALYLASLDGIKQTMIREADPGPDYAKYMDDYTSKKNANLPVRIEVKGGADKESTQENSMVELRELENNINAVVQHAYYYFGISKGLIIGVPFSFKERNDSRAFFLQRTSEDAFKLIATELNFMYEALYTKVVVAHSVRGYIFRAISFSAVCIAFRFFYQLEKQGFHGFDVGITYTLLYGAIGLDVLSILMLIFSDWTVVALKNSWQNSWIAIILSKYLNLKTSRWSTAETTNCLEWTRKFLFERWSELVSAFNLLDYSLQDRPTLNPKFIDYCGNFYLRITDFLGFKDLQDKRKYMSSKPLTQKLWDFIFKELRRKSVLADDFQVSKTVCSSRGEYILQNTGGSCTNLLPYVVDVDYVQSILLWHIATELCYNTDKSNAGRGGEDLPKYSKTLSDYMLYLLVMQPAMMSSIAGIAQNEFKDTCAEAKRFFTRRELEPFVGLEEACERILEVNTEVKPVAVKGDSSKSVLFDACILAKALTKLDEMKWDIISKVWVELLSYAASHCRANSHAELLSQGGELVTFVWLLMARFGIAEQFQVKEGQSSVKLVLEKSVETLNNEVDQTSLVT